MSRRPALITPADVARCCRAAKALGPEWFVEVQGSIIRVAQAPSTSDRPSPGREPEFELGPRFARGLASTP
jgi:hypothetical protein